MNASYKIVLLGAFVLFAAVVGYYIFSGDGDVPKDLALNDDYPAQDQNGQIERAPAPGPDTTRPTLVPPPVEEAPVIEQETIGERLEELPDAPVIESRPDDEPLALDDPTDNGIRPEPGATEESGTEERAPVTEQAAGPDEELRPAPQPETSDPIEETTEPGTQAEPEREPEPAPPSRPIPPAPGTIPRTYTVQSGDTFASIAVKFYGEERAWFDIAQANPSVDPKRLQVDQVIVLPNRDAKVREREEVRPPAPGKDQSYTVQPGDNLSKIAKKFYGNSEQWDLIYARNRKLIGPRPDALKVGMEIVIPQAYEGAQ